MYASLMNIATKIRSRIYTALLDLLLLTIKWLRMKRSISMIDIDEKSKATYHDNLEKQLDLSIVITTFEARFFDYTLPLISKIRSVTNTPIFVIINGNFKNDITEKKLQFFIKELGSFSNIYPTTLLNFHGCAELWNIGITNSDTEYFLVLNDDIHIFQDIFKNFLTKIGNALDNHQLITINRSFSHFGISRKCISDVGFFDEHYLGIGEEDRDYFYRFEATYGRKPFNISTEAFYNFGDQSRDENVKPASGGKYSAFNSKIKEDFYVPDPNGLITGRYESPMKRVKVFINPRPIWTFRKMNYNKLSE